MKKLLAAAITVVMSFISNVQASELKEMLLEAIPGYYAEIDNMSGIDYGLEVMTWGAKVENYILKDKKTILTFDTSKIPANATIEYVYIYAGIKELNGLENLTSGQQQQYIMDNLVAEFSPIGGFGGSYFPTAYDYYAYAVNNTPVESYGFWLVDQTSYVNLNRYGYTQIRIGFKQNPALATIIAEYNWPGMEQTNPQIKIRYTEN